MNKASKGLLGLYGLFANSDLKSKFTLSNKINFKANFYNKKIQHQPKKQIKGN